MPELISSLISAFEKWWPDLEKALSTIQVPTGAPPRKRNEQDLLEEILETVRSIARAQSVEAQARETAVTWGSGRVPAMSAAEKLAELTGGVSLLHDKSGPEEKDQLEEKLRLFRQALRDTFAKKT